MQQVECQQRQRQQQQQINKWPVDLSWGCTAHRRQGASRSSEISATCLLGSLAGRMPMAATRDGRDGRGRVDGSEALWSAAPDDGRDRGSHHHLDPPCSKLRGPDPEGAGKTRRPPAAGGEEMEGGDGSSAGVSHSHEKGMKRDTNMARSHGDQSGGLEQAPFRIILPWP